MNDKALELLKDHEGYRQFPYRCTAGKLTIGYGLNLEDTGLTEAESTLLLRLRVARIELALSERIACWDFLTRRRKDVLTDMAYNLGVSGLMKFRRMLAALDAGLYVAASAEMMDSRWATQVGQRAVRLALRMKD